MTLGEWNAPPQCGAELFLESGKLVLEDKGEVFSKEGKLQGPPRARMLNMLRKALLLRHLAVQSWMIELPLFYLIYSPTALTIPYQAELTHQSE